MHVIGRETAALDEIRLPEPVGADDRTGFLSTSIRQDRSGRPACDLPTHDRTPQGDSGCETTMGRLGGGELLVGAV